MRQHQEQIEENQALHTQRNELLNEEMQALDVELQQLLNEKEHLVQQCLRYEERRKAEEAKKQVSCTHNSYVL
jgi:hypothetical protein